MTSLERHLIAYAEYHRDKRNIATHAVGIPLIVFSVIVLVSRPESGFDVAGVHVTVSAAWLLAIASSLYYLRIDRFFGALMTIGIVLLVAAATPIAASSTPVWLATGAGGFIIGWIAQFIGHAYEGRKPAFFDDLRGLAIGPLFVMAELLFALGAKREIEHEIERVAGPRRIRRSAAPAS